MILRFMKDTSPQCWEPGFNTKYHAVTRYWTRTASEPGRCANHYTTLHCTALHCTALHCTALHSTALHCTALHCTALHCTALHCTALHYTTLHYMHLSRADICHLYVYCCMGESKYTWIMQLSVLSILLYVVSRAVVITNKREKHASIYQA